MSEEAIQTNNTWQRNCHNKRHEGQEMSQYRHEGQGMSQYRPSPGLSEGAYCYQEISMMLILGRWMDRLDLSKPEQESSFIEFCH